MTIIDYDRCVFVCFYGVIILTWLFTCMFLVFSSFRLWLAELRLCKHSWSYFWSNYITILWWSFYMVFSLYLSVFFTFVFFFFFFIRYTLFMIGVCVYVFTVAIENSLSHSSSSRGNRTISGSRSSSMKNNGDDQWTH